MSSRILVVEDDERIRSSMRLALEDEGYAVDDAGSGEEALDRFAGRALRAGPHRPHAAGHRRLRDAAGRCAARARCPIIMVTARTDTHDVVAGLEAGADDYVTKPFVAKELGGPHPGPPAPAPARRRTSRPSSRFGDVELDARRRACCAGRRRPRSTAPGPSSACLCELAANPGKVLSREQLLERVWGYDYFGDGRLVDVHVRRLRTKVEPDPALPATSSPSAGMGYKLVP